MVPLQHTGPDPRQSLNSPQVVGWERDRESGSRQWGRERRTTFLSKSRMPWHENITALTFFINQPFQLGSLSRNLAGETMRCFVRRNLMRIFPNIGYSCMRCLLSPEAYYGQVTAVHTKHINENISGHCCSLPVLHHPHNLRWKMIVFKKTQPGLLQPWPWEAADQQSGLELSWLVFLTCVLNSKWLLRVVEGGAG